MTPQRKKLRILVVDDHLVVRMGIASLLALEKDMEIVGEATDGAEAVQAAKSLRPDVVLMDLMMPTMGGLEATAQIMNEIPETRVLVLTTFSESPDVRKALDAGAAGAIVKDANREAFVSAIRQVISGEKVVSREMLESLNVFAGMPDLSPRQREIVRYVAKGLNNKEIASLLGIGRDCVKAHLKAAFSRLGVASRSEAAALAVRCGIIEV